jgi:hypothetical protein
MQDILDELGALAQAPAEPVAVGAPAVAVGAKVAVVLAQVRVDM